jgi:hypothetical protein
VHSVRPTNRHNAITVAHKKDAFVFGYWSLLPGWFDSSAMHRPNPTRTEFLPCRRSRSRKRLVAYYPLRGSLDENDTLVILIKRVRIVKRKIFGF